MTTRDRILGTSLDLFGTRGVDAVSLDEIARVVGVRKQTVLYWFESKDVLVGEVLGVAATELVVVIEPLGVEHLNLTALPVIEMRGRFQCQLFDVTRTPGMPDRQHQ